MNKDNVILETPKGHKIVLGDENDELCLHHASGSEIRITSDEISLKIGSSQIVLRASEVNVNNGALVVK